MLEQDFGHPGTDPVARDEIMVMESGCRIDLAETATIDGERDGDVRADNIHSRQPDTELADDAACQRSRFGMNSVKNDMILRGGILVDRFLDGEL